MLKTCLFHSNLEKYTLLLGLNGTGKSTLLKTLFGDIQPTSGDISFRDTSLKRKQISRWREQFGYMPQDIRLDIGFSVCLKLCYWGN
ncbi:ATP-binding cassette domain-containing protein [Marinomonas rhodophyticola]|uniref:ATP-binding cassette domain-containing protein n=1 Tax=Marinomonas rhodophyticola TaxID=2992803 RepID=UPI002AA29E65|nr:ATP-binding cassette domain-containing protein [Marinomonas sp. KJ51-3]